MRLIRSASSGAAPRTARAVSSAAIASVHFFCWTRISASRNRTRVSPNPARRSLADQVGRPRPSPRSSPRGPAYRPARRPARRPAGPRTHAAARPRPGRGVPSRVSRRARLSAKADVLGIEPVALLQVGPHRGRVSLLLAGHGGREQDLAIVGGQLQGPWRGPWRRPAARIPGSTAIDRHRPGPTAGFFAIMSCDRAGGEIVLAQLGPAQPRQPIVGCRPGRDRARSRGRTHCSASCAVPRPWSHWPSRSSSSARSTADECSCESAGTASSNSASKSLGVAEASQLHGQVGTAAFELAVTGVMTERLLMDQEHTFDPPATRVLLVHDPGIPRPGRPVVRAEAQIPCFSASSTLSASLADSARWARSSRAEAFRRIWKPCTRCMPPPNRAVTTRSTVRKRKLSLLIVVEPQKELYPAESLLCAALVFGDSRFPDSK